MIKDIHTDNCCLTDGCQYAEPHCTVFHNRQAMEEHNDNCKICKEYMRRIAPSAIQKFTDKLISKPPKGSGPVILMGMTALFLGPFIMAGTAIYIPYRFLKNKIKKYKENK